MIVYRIAKEVPNRPEAFPVGPYQWVDENLNYPPGIDKMGDAHRDRSHPLPGSEGHWMSFTDVCGFTDEFRLLLWFDGFLDMLHENGFLIYEYDVPEWHVVDLTYQSVFSRVSAVLVRSYPINP